MHPFTLFKKLNVLTIAHWLAQFCSTTMLKVGHTPLVVQQEKIDFVVLYNDLIDYIIVCLEHQCNTMGAI